jgi:hypothetical protein
VWRFRSPHEKDALPGWQAATMTEVADKRNAIKPLLASAQFLS